MEHWTQVLKISFSVFCTVLDRCWFAGLDQYSYRNMISKLFCPVIGCPLNQKFPSPGTRPGTRTWIRSRWDQEQNLTWQAVLSWCTWVYTHFTLVPLMQWDPSTEHPKSGWIWILNFLEHSPTAHTFTIWIQDLCSIQIPTTVILS